MEAISEHDALQRFETIWANVECGISIIDAETREILDINPVAVRMFGGAKGDIVGKRCHKFICPAEEHSCPIMDKNQVVDRSERKFIKADGDVLAIVKSVAKIHYNGRLALLESFTDISNLKKAEEQLRLMSIAEQANKAKSDFLSRMSHEMRTPMNAIIGMAKIAEGTDDTERLKYCLSMIGQSSAHLLGLINDVLDMSKIEANMFELHDELLRVEDVLAKICNITIENVEKKNLRFNVFLDMNACIPFLGDDLRLSQVIANLVSNAVKFTPASGEIVVTVRETERKPGSSVLLFTVTDSGIGMTDAQRARLFNAFEQADTSISRRFGGTGLGLAISKNIIEKMGGRIWVESEIGKGSSFTFEVELRHAAPAQAEPAAPRPNLDGMRVLVVSNDGRIGDYFRSVASTLGVETDTLTEAEELLPLVGAAYRGKRPYDMIFVDYTLRCDDIAEVIQKLHGLTPVGAIMLMSSFLTWNKIDARTRGAGVSRFIPMPLLPSNILDSLTWRGEGSCGVPEMPCEAVGEKQDFSGVTLLLAEDVEINSEIFKALLEDTHIAIDIAGNGLAAIEMFKGSPGKYDMIIMDVHMPEMDGYEATRNIRALEAESGRERLPIIAMTANVFREDIEKCIACGMDDHLAKPIDVDEVRRKVAAYRKKP